MTVARRSDRRPRRDDERGVTLIFVAIVMAVLLMVAALVVDLGLVRVGAGFDQSAADLAALAGGPELINDDYEGACREIIEYVESNARGIDTIDAGAFCSDFGITTCSGGTLAQATPTLETERYTVAMRFPVPDAEIADPTFGAGLADGLPCERITVSLTSREPSIFGGIMGHDGYAVTRRATVRGGASQTPLVPALWMLDPVGCPPLTVQGGSQVTVGDTSDPLDVVRGVIALDSDGSDLSECSATQPTLVVGGSGTSLRASPTTGPPDVIGQIGLHALPFGATSCTGTTACHQSAVPSQVSPQPVPVARRATRAPVDWAWNCKDSYPDYLGIPIEGCPFTDSRGAYIDRLVAAVGGSGLPSSGFSRWSASHSCNVSGHIVVHGNWWVDCPTPNGLQISNGNSVTFADGNVVFDGGVKVNSGGVLEINTNNGRGSLSAGCLPPSPNLPCIGEASTDASWAYVRRGDWTLGGGVFTGHHVALVLGPNSFVTGTGGAPPNWTAPIEGPFLSLALWAEAAGAFNVAGGAGVSLEGTFFTPFADELTLTGGGDWGQQHAQFISYRLKVSGGSRLSVSPDPSTSVPMPPPAATLIR